VLGFPFEKEKNNSQQSEVGEAPGAF